MFGSIILIVEINFLVGLTCLLPVLWLLFYYYPKGDLSVEVTDEIICFSFDEKLLFNHKPIPCIPVNDIEYIVIDQQMMLKKIYTKNEVIRLGTAKLFKLDSQKLVDELKAICVNRDIMITDSWGEWKERNLLQKAYYINRILVGIAILAIVVLSIIKGFKPQYLFVIMPLLLQAILYGIAMKDTLKKP